MNFHIHFWKKAWEIQGDKYQECRCKDRRIINSTGIMYSNGKHVHFYGQGYQPFDTNWLNNEETCKFHKKGKCYIDDMTGKIECTGKDHDLEHCGDYQAYKAEETV